MVNEFWKDWKRKTKLEESAIQSLKSAKKIILQNIPKNEIIAIYVKGSFVRREMNKKSDVDTSIILKHSKWLSKLKTLQKRYRKEFKPNLEFTGYSLWELKNNKKSRTGKADRASPSRAVQHLEHYKLIYGQALKKEEFYQGDDTKRLRALVRTFKTLFLPGYKKKEIGFSGIVKQTFWLVENEQKFKGNNPPHHFGKLAKSIKDKNHIIHDTLRFRKKPTKDKKLRSLYIKKLKTYLKGLEKIHN